MFDIFKKTTLRQEEVQQLLKEKTAKLIDVRESKEYSIKKISGAINYPLSKLQNSHNIDTILPDKSAPIILYCASGGRSKLAAKLLKYQGYEKVYDFGSIDNWK